MLELSELTQNDIHFCVSRLPKDVVDLMKNYGLLMAGGFIRETISGGKVNDIDLFSGSSADLKHAAMELAVARKGRIHETENAYTLLSPPRRPVQFITRWLAPDYGEYVRLFDFTVCQAGIWWHAETNSWKSACHPHFYADLAARRLVYTFPNREEEAGGSMLRVRKFIQRGYDIQVQSLAGVMSRVFMQVYRDGNYKNERELACIITGILREVDPLSIIDGVEVPDSTPIDTEFATLQLPPQ